MQMHWVEETRRHARCAGAGCFLCEENNLAKDHHAVVVEVDGGGIRLLELSEAHSHIAKKLSSRGLDAIGSFLYVKLDPEDGVTREIDLHPDRLKTRPVPCSRYVEAIGRKQYEQAQQMRLQL